MRDIKHANLCLFIGACIDTEHVAILNEVCGKGSLEDILSNDDIDLGWDFRYSMMKVSFMDLCKSRKVKFAKFLKLAKYMTYFKIYKLYTPTFRLRIFKISKEC